VQQTGNVVHGRGFSFGTFASSQVGLVADITVDKKTGKILVKHVVVAQNNGITVSLDGVANQMSGALIQGLSRALYEQPQWNKERVTSLDWVTYPILRFKDHPNITYTVTQRLDLPSTGAGEPPDAAIPAAIANAFFDATGVRIRETPLTPARVRAVLKAAGK
jgi:CO/xanthine dehydrogenase Mo-binding subunit